MNTLNNLNTTFKNAFNTVTDFVFPVSSEEVERQRLHKRKSGFEYVTNLPLQMCLYYNAFFAPIWFIGTALCMELEFPSLPGIYKVVNLALVVFFGVLECVRLYLGYIGNLTEKVPELAGSWLLTVLMQLPSICFLLFNTQMILSPFERTLHIFEFIFIVFESIMGYLAIKMMVNHQAVKIHLHMEFQQAEAPPVENNRVTFRGGSSGRRLGTDSGRYVA